MINEKKIEVTYADTDAMGVVYHANYLVWFEIGRSSFYKELGYSMMESIDKGIIFPITNIEIKYKTPSKYGDEISVKTEVFKIKKTSTTYLQRAYANGVLSCEAYITIAHVNAENFKPINIEKFLPEVYYKYSEVMTSGK